MTDWGLINSTLRTEDTPAHLELQDALRGDHGDDSDFVVAVPMDWTEPDAPPPTADELEGAFPWTFEQIEGTVGDAKRAYYEHDYMREMMHYEFMRAGA